jgi:hypothetical protein
LEDLDVLGDGWERHVKRLGELVDGRLTLGETGQDRPTGRVGECGERLAEPVFFDSRRRCSDLYFPKWLINQYGK